MLDCTWHLDMWVSNFISDESLYLKEGSGGEMGSKKLSLSP